MAEMGSKGVTAGKFASNMQKKLTRAQEKVSAAGPRRPPRLPSAGLPPGPRHWPPHPRPRGDRAAPLLPPGPRAFLRTLTAPPAPARSRYPAWRPRAAKLGGGRGRPRRSGPGSCGAGRGCPGPAAAPGSPEAALHPPLPGSARPCPRPPVRGPRFLSRGRLRPGSSGERRAARPPGAPRFRRGRGVAAGAGSGRAGPRLRSRAGSAAAHARPWRSDPEVGDAGTRSCGPAWPVGSRLWVEKDFGSWARGS